MEPDSAGARRELTLAQRCVPMPLDALSRELRLQQLLDIWLASCLQCAYRRGRLPSGEI
jgi:hypothetical protein